MLPVHITLKVGVIPVTNYNITIVDLQPLSLFATWFVLPPGPPPLWKLSFDHHSYPCLHEPAEKITRITKQEALATVCSEKHLTLCKVSVWLAHPIAYRFTSALLFNACTCSSVCLSFTSNILLSLTTFLPWHFLHLSLGLSTSPKRSQTEHHMCTFKTRILINQYLRHSKWYGLAYIQTSLVKECLQWFTHFNNSWLLVIINNVSI